MVTVLCICISLLIFALLVPNDASPDQVFESRPEADKTRDILLSIMDTKAATKLRDEKQISEDNKADIIGEYVPSLLSAYHDDILMTSKGLYRNGDMFAYMNVIKGNDSKTSVVNYEVEEYPNIDYSIRGVSKQQQGELYNSQKCPAKLTRKVGGFDTLVVFTTCNHVNMTILALRYLLPAVSSIADLIVIDDYSTDGTPNYLMRHGYHVITKEKPLGLTDSWNRGYHFARKFGYKFVVFANNDVLVPLGSLQQIRSSLFINTVAVPLSTKLGAGHNPAQFLGNVHKIPDRLSDYIDNPHNVFKIQESLTKLYFDDLSKYKKSKEIDPKNYTTFGATTSSIWNGRSKFNGFFFGVNLERVSKYATRDPEYLFDPNLVMVGQEDSLATKMLNDSDIPVIAKYAFVYHFKSVTISIARKDSNKPRPDYRNRDGSDSRDDLNQYHKDSNQDLSKFVGLLELRGFSLYPDSEDQVVTIGFAVSDPVANPSAGDVFTAIELGNALLKKFSGISIEYLYKGRTWYDLSIISKLDVLVVLLDDYDITKVHSVGPFQTESIKPSLLTIAWARNWFQRWLQRPHIGNYDALLVSSETAAVAFQVVSSSLGLQISCFQNCPKLILNPGKDDNKLCEAKDLPVQTRKSIIPLIAVLRLGTNPDRFYPGRSTRRFLGDFAFTGSYHNRFRRIMGLDVERLGVKFDPLIVGSGWEKANVSVAWINHSIGSVPYTMIPQVYRSVKIVIDDANHVTEPWGSVNSRVFDALASGALVITNGILGSMETFYNKLPTYVSYDDLNEKIEYYLEKKQARKDLVEDLRNQILQNHTYTKRADELAAILQKFGVELTPSSRENNVKVESVSSKRKNLCVGVRTMPAQYKWLNILLRSLTTQHSRSKWKDVIGLDIYLVDTELQSSDFMESLKLLADEINAFASQSGYFRKEVDTSTNQNTYVHVYWDELQPLRTKANPFYGYDTTDDLLNLLVNKESCEWIMFTNGDNMYNSAWFDAIAPSACQEKPEIDMIGWDFITHHPRNGGSFEQPIHVAIQRGSVDLGSIMVRRSVYQKSAANFLPDAYRTDNMFARDYFALVKMMDFVRDGAVKLIHRCLMFHQ